VNPGSRLANGAPMVPIAGAGKPPAPKPEHVLALAEDLRGVVEALAEAVPLLSSERPADVLAGAVAVDLERSRLALVGLQLRNLAAAMPKGSR
jgi:hypothetical protein